MATRAIISYDDSRNDCDALMLGRLLRDAGAALALAYVRHVTHACPGQELLAGDDAETLLSRGATWLADPGVDRHVVMSASTGAGLSWLAEELGADVVVFGSEYRTRAGHVAPTRSAQSLLENGPAAIALAPAEYASADRRIATIGVLRGTADEASIETAFAVAARHDATVVDRDRDVDLLIAGSRPEAPYGRVMLTSRAQHAIEEATAPVIVVARGVALTFDTLIAA